MQEVERPVYDFIESDRKEERVSLVPADAIIVDGIFALHDVSKLKQIQDKVTKLYIESDSYLDSLNRRITRDESLHGRDAVQSRQKELKTVRGAFFEYIAPCKSKADFIITNNKTTQQSDIEKDLSQVVEQIQEKLNSNPRPGH